MAQVFPFIPQPQSNFEFSPTLDGLVYNAIVTWNIYAQRYYVSVYDLSRNLVFSLPMLGSPTGFSISTMEWSNGKVTVTTNARHRYRVYQTSNLTLSGCAPAAYNGVFPCLILNQTQFSFPLSENPGAPSLLGNVDYNVNIAGGYFDQSVMVFRQDAQRFEVTP